MLFKLKSYIRRRLRPRSRPRKKISKKKVASHSSFHLHKKVALELCHARLAHFNSFYNLSYKKVSIKNQTSRWGSCSRRGNLNFNYRIALLPPEIADYIIVHELCHLGEFNHSKKFWDLVAKTVPDWNKLRAQLKEEGKRLF